jgi:hypothetical protein
MDVDLGNLVGDAIQFAAGVIGSDPSGIDRWSLVGRRLFIKTPMAMSIRRLDSNAKRG